MFRRLGGLDGTKKEEENRHIPGLPSGLGLELQMDELEGPSLQ